MDLLLDLIVIILLSGLGYLARNYSKDMNYKQVLSDAVKYGTQRAYTTIVKDAKKENRFEPNIQQRAMSTARTEATLFAEKRGISIDVEILAALIEEQVVRMKNGKVTGSTDTGN
ncbi:MAG: hypothetical protein ACW98X_20075 [Promethearchaeota archaeon]|jgi:hypothetical protein